MGSAKGRVKENNFALDAKAQTLVLLIWVEILLTVAGDVIKLFVAKSNPAMDILMWGTIVPSMVLWMVNTTLFMKWLHCAFSNLTSEFGVEGLSCSPKQAVWAWLIPIRNLWKPYKYMRELWQASDPHSRTSSWRANSVPSEFRIWWAAWLGDWAFNIFSIATVVGLRLGDWESWTGTFCWTLYAVLSIRIIQRITERQHQIYHQFEQAALLKCAGQTVDDSTRINLAEPVFKDTSARSE